MNEIITFDSIGEELQEYLLNKNTRYMDDEKYENDLEYYSKEIEEMSNKYPCLLGSTNDLCRDTILIKILINIIQNDHK